MRRVTIANEPEEIGQVLAKVGLGPSPGRGRATEGAGSGPQLRPSAQGRRGGGSNAPQGILSYISWTIAAQSVPSWVVEYSIAPRSAMSPRGYPQKS